MPASLRSDYPKIDPILLATFRPDPVAIFTGIHKKRNRNFCISVNKYLHVKLLTAPSPASASVCFCIIFVFMKQIKNCSLKSLRLRPLTYSRVHPFTDASKCSLTESCSSSSATSLLLKRFAASVMIFFFRHPQ